MTPVDMPLGVVAVSFVIALVRVAIGPSLADRAVGGEVCLVTLVGGIALLAARLESTHFLDAVVVAALVQFIATIALALLLERKETG